MISLIIPIYNVAPYLRKCLDSIKGQDCGDWEALLIDDGSSDGTGEICDEYAQKDNRFRVFHKDNGGVSSARNLGLENANGDWIWFVDGDDWIERNSISVLSKTTESVNCDIVIFGINYYDEGLNIVGSERRLLSIDKSKVETVDEYDFPPQNYIVRRSVIENNNIRFSEGVAMGEDLEFQYKCLMLCRKPITIPEILYCYLRRQGSATKNEKSRENAANSSTVILRNLVNFIVGNNIEESLWLSARMNRVFKNTLSSHALINRFDRCTQQTLQEARTNLCNHGYKDFLDAAVRVGCFNMRFYAWFIKLRKLMR